MSRRGWWLFLALGLIWGIPYLLIRIAVGELPPVFVAFARTGIGALLLLPIAMMRGELRAALRHWRPLLLFTLVEISVPWWLLGYAETRINSSTAGLLIALVPVITAGLMAASGRETLDGRRALGLALGLGGVAALVGLHIDLSHGWAVAAALATALGYALGPIVISRSLSAVPPLGVIAASLALATLLYVPFALPLWPAQVGLQAGAAVLTLGVVCTAVAFLLFFALIAEVGPTRATVITYVNPVVALLLGVTLLDEPLTAGMLVGFALVLLGSFLATSRGGSAHGTAPARERA
ncbi:DMT family transporter [Lysobacter silvisoli]|uniref:DMT family transporter n=1 Tax=Lysobacter silvisoli TaxID=2293254 RepID=A0A371JWX2_9GAMM|nr:DMT family transporter [Lysobacter silvisoli]RDZ26163.1 DMT family transporter [Lysobacter silvisoli]